MEQSRQRMTPSMVTLPRRSGFTLLEVAMAVSLLTVTFIGFAIVLVSNARSYDHVQERSLAIHTLRSMAEELRGAPFSNVESIYRNHKFDIEDIDAKGRVTFFLNERESSADAALLGLPRDLNGNGNASDANVRDDYKLLPVKLEVTWTDPRGQQSESLFFLLTQESN